jgi:PBSX family phage terminase large subunit
MNFKPMHKLFEKQKQVIRAKARFILYSGGYACGKTLAGCYWIMKKAIKNPGSIGCIMSPTHRMLQDNILRTNLLPLLEYCNESMGRTFFKYNSAMDQNYIELINGSKIRLRPFDDEGKIRGGDYSYIWLDEAIGRDRIYLTQSRFNQIRARLRRGEDQQILFTTNPGSKSHFLYEYFVKSEDENKEIIFGSIYDNPYLTEDYITDMRNTYTEDELLGKWVRNVGVVYDEFDRQIHTVDEVTEDNLNYSLCVDFGTDNPFACLLIGVDHDNTYHVIDEVYGGMLTSDAIPLIQDMIGDRRIEEIICDNNSPDGADELETELDIPVQRVRFRHKLVNQGIRLVKKKLRLKADGKPRLIISDKCINLIEEFESYIWDRDKDEDGKDKPIKKNDHALDALRYFTTYQNL